MKARQDILNQQLKERQLIQEQKFQQKKWKDAEKAGDYFSELPLELVFGVFHYSSESDIKQLAYVSKSFNGMVLGYFRTTFFFAVSDNIHLFTNQYYINQWANCIVSSEINRDVDFEIIKKDIPKNRITLFSDYSEAQSYCRFVARRSFDESNDFFVTESIPAVLVVKLHRADVFFIEKCNEKVKETIPNCPRPPIAKEKSFSIFKTPTKNVDIPFALFQGTLFCKPLPEGEFTEIWNDALNLNLSANMEGKLIAALKAVFNSYVTWPHHYLTRHHHDKVAVILMLLDGNQPISNIITHLNRFENGIPPGHFTRMIEFSLTALQPYADSHQLKGIENIFLNNRMQIGNKKT